MPVRILTAVVALALAGCSSAGRARPTTPTGRPSTHTTTTVPAGNASTAPNGNASLPSRPVSPSSPTRRSAAPSRLAPVSAAARAAGLVDIHTVVPEALVDLRYATTDNFTHVRLYPHGARCLVHQSMAQGLAAAARTLRRAGFLLVFWDCYRPHSVQQRMWRVVPNPAWVARPGPYARSHEAGRSVDVTLARAATSGGCATTRVAGHCLLAMGTGFDDFTPRAYAYATDGVSTRAQRDRATLRTAMNAGGLTVYSGEWWHFDGPGSAQPRPILQAPPY